MAKRHKKTSIFDPDFLDMSFLSPRAYKKLLTFPEASEIYSIPLRTLYKLSSRKRIPKVKIGRSVYIEPHSFEGWLESNFIDGIYPEKF